MLLALRAQMCLSTMHRASWAVALRFQGKVASALFSATQVFAHILCKSRICECDACIYAGYLLHSLGTSTSTCTYTFQCVAVTQLPQDPISKNYLYYFSPNLPVDSLLVDTTTSSCTPVLGLTDVLVNPSAASQQWLQQPTSCIGACGSPLQLCYAANTSQIINPQLPWYGLASPMNCTKCPSAPLLPSGSQVMGSGCQASVICPLSNYYFNSTAWQCESCLVRQQQVLLVCPHHDNNNNKKNDICRFVPTTPG